MFKFSLTILLLATVIWSQEINPSYKYRYQKEDLMKTAESEIPMRGYHVTEGEYYPAQSVGGIGIGGGYGGGQFIGGGGGGGRFIGGGGGQYLGGGGGRFIGSGGQFIGGGGGQFIGGGGGGGGFIGKPFIGGSGQFIGGGLGGGGGQFIGGGGYGGGGFVGGGYSPYYHHGSGGQVLDKQEFSGGSKKLNDEGYQKLNGAKGEEFSDGQEGYNKGQVAVKNSKGDSGYYNEAEAGKKAVGDEKTYHGNQHFDEQGKAGGEKKNNEYHKKGHVIKGFKSSHHKDEDGKTEEFYDEEHNSGDNYNYDGQTGSFGKNAGGSYKGGHDNGQFNAVENKKQGQYDNHHIVDNSNAGQGQYGQKKYGGSGESFGSQNGVDQHSLLGHQEANKIYKHHPYHVPIFQY